MSTKVSAPKPTAEENALRAEQTELLRSQRDILTSQAAQQKALLPLFASQLGINLQFDAAGNVIGGSPTAESQRQSALQSQVLEKTLNQILHPESDPVYAKQLELYTAQLDKAKKDAELDPMRQDIERQLLERSGKALRGELEIDPALERDITNQRDTLEERLRSQFGAGWDTSSAGIEALSKFEESANVLRDQARKGELTLSEQLSLARQGADIAQGTSNIQQATSVIPGINPLQGGSFAFGLGQGGNQSLSQLGQVLSGPMGVAGGYGQVAQGFQLPIGQLQNTRQMQLDASIANSRNSMGMLGGIGSIFGSILGLA